MLSYQYTRIAVYVVGLDDTRQYCWLAWLESGRPDRFSFDVLNLARSYLFKLYRLITKERRMNLTNHYSFRQEFKNEFIENILNYYEDHTATETMKRFNIQDTGRIRDLLSRCLPKPERKSGKKFGEKREKVFTNLSFKELINEGLNNATAFRAAKRGYYYKLIQKTPTQAGVM